MQGFESMTSVANNHENVSYIGLKSASLINRAENDNNVNFIGLYAVWESAVTRNEEKIRARLQHAVMCKQHKDMLCPPAAV
jgi:hypothetical protein